MSSIPTPPRPRATSHPTRRPRHSRPARTARRQRVRTAGAARRQLERLSRAVPRAAGAVLEPLAGAFTRPTFRRIQFLALAAILTVGRRTIGNLLRTLGALVPGHPSSYHRVFSRRRWSGWGLARRLAGWVLDHLVPDGPVLLAGDDTVDEHPGDRVFGKGCHRDPVRSTRSYTAFRWGHKWVVLAVLVRFPFTHRPWALPILVALYRTPDDDRKAGRRHKTPADLVRQLCRVLLRWFRQRRFVLTVDGNYATHALARFAAGRADRLSLVSPFYPDANLYDPPPPYRGCGRPRVKGAKLPTPEQTVATAARTRVNVAWYGGGRRDVEVVSRTGRWYRAGHGLVPVRWVFVHDRTGTHRDSYFLTTDGTMTAQQVIETYTARWNLETTFQEMRSYLGLESTRGWAEKTVLRAAPCLFGLYTVVAVLYRQLPRRFARVQGVSWVGKQDVTFSDAITAVRLYLWIEWVFAIPGHRAGFQNLPRPFRALLGRALAPAA